MVGVDRADPAALGGEEDPALPVGHGRDHAVALGDGGRVGAGVRQRRGPDGHLPQLVAGGEHVGVVVPVEVEVGAAAQVAERVRARGQVPRGHVERGDLVQRRRVDQPHREALGATAETDDPLAGVEADGGALRDAVAGRPDLQVAAERPAHRVGVGGVGVVVHRVGAVGSEERVGGDRGMRDRLLDGRRAREGLTEQVGRQRRDRERVGMDPGGHQQQCCRGQCRQDHSSSGHARSTRSDPPGYFRRIALTRVTRSRRRPSRRDDLRNVMPSGFIGCRRASVPPSAKTTEPTSRLASSESRKAISPATSSGRPGRFKAVG